MTPSLVHLVEVGGLVAIFLTMILESCGIPLSIEVIAPVGGALAAQGKLPLVGVIVAAVIGNLLGAFIAYGLARRFGRRLVLGPGRYVGLSEGHLALADRFFARMGAWAVLIGRVLPAIRTYISFPAGLARMDVLPFGIMTLVGSALFATFLTLAGYKLGQHWQQLASTLGKLTIPFAILLCALVIIAYLIGRRWVHQRGEVGPQQS